MIGVYDFCGHYEWTFAWLEARGGKPLLEEFWDEAIHKDSQIHAAALIQSKGIQGMAEYWGHTLAEEKAGYTSAATSDRFRINMTDCPSRGFLLRNNLTQHTDYCDHCIGWIGPMMDQAGFETLHEHNHCGQCRWEFRKNQNAGVTDDAREGLPADEDDVRNHEDWQPPGARIDRFHRS